MEPRLAPSAARMTRPYLFPSSWSLGGGGQVSIERVEGDKSRSVQSEEGARHLGVHQGGLVMHPGCPVQDLPIKGSFRGNLWDEKARQTQTE